MGGIFDNFNEYGKWGASKFSDLFGFPFVNETKDDGLKWHLKEIREKTGIAISELETEVEGKLEKGNYNGNADNLSEAIQARLEKGEFEGTAKELADSKVSLKGYNQNLGIFVEDLDILSNETYENSKYYYSEINKKIYRYIGITGVWVGLEDSVPDSNWFEISVKRNPDLYSEWKTIPDAGNWSNSPYNKNPMQYRIAGNIMQVRGIRGNIQNSGASGDIIFNVPSGISIDNSKEQNLFRSIIIGTPVGMEAAYISYNAELKAFVLGTLSSGINFAIFNVDFPIIV